MEIGLLKSFQKLPSFKEGKKKTRAREKLSVRQEQCKSSKGWAELLEILEVQYHGSTVEMLL